MTMFSFQPYWFWWIFAAFLLVLEVFAPGTFFLWIAVSAIVVGFLVLMFPQIGVEWQVLILSIGSISTIFMSRSYFKKYPIESDQPLLNQRGAQYVGHVYALSEPIVNGIGKIHVDDSTWRVKGHDCPVGTRVKVIAAEGVNLKVEIAENDKFSR